MVVPPTPAGDAGVTDDRAPSATPASSERPAARMRVRLLAALLALLLLGVAALVWVALSRAGGPGGGDADTAQEERDAVMSTSEQFLLRMGTYGPDLVDDEGRMTDYRDRVEEVITDKFAEDFAEQATVAEQLVAQADQQREAEVFASGVASVDDDTATTLVAGAFTDTYGDGEPQAPSSFRMEVELVRVDGEWLVDDFSPLGGGQEGPGDGSGDGSGQGSGQGSGESSEDGSRQGSGGGSDDTGGEDQQ